MLSCKVAGPDVLYRKRSFYGKRVPKPVGLKSLPYDSVMSDYLSAYTMFVCKPAVLQECLKHMIVPPPSEQLRVMQDLFDVVTKVDPMGLEGVFMKLLLVNDQKAVDTLVDSLHMYNDSIEIVNAIIRYSYSIPIQESNITT